MRNSPAGPDGVGVVKPAGDSGPGRPADVEARRALRRVASGVTVLTVNHNGLRHGTTVSAVVAISRDPLLLGVCLRASSAFTSMVARRQLFSVNVLTAGQAQVAERFADPARRPGDDQFAGLEWTTDPITDAPLLHGCLAHMACRSTDCGPIGDHDLIVAQVVRGAPRSGAPLLSFAGRLTTGEPAASPPPRTDPVAHPLRSEAR